MYHHHLLNHHLQQKMVRLCSKTYIKLGPVQVEQSLSEYALYNLVETQSTTQPPLTGENREFMQ